MILSINILIVAKLIGQILNQIYKYFFKKLHTELFTVKRRFLFEKQKLVSMNYLKGLKIYGIQLYFKISKN